MLEQPEFGRRLRQLRQQQGRSQADLTGTGMSAAYLSRLESGARPPTERAVAYLAARLDLPVEAFELPADCDLADALAATMGRSDPEGDPEVRDMLSHALANAEDADPTTRWQALAQLARLHGALGDRGPERDTLLELTALSDELARPALQVHARLQLARCARGLGDPRAARRAVREALDLGARHHVHVPAAELTRARMLLVSTEAELGDLAEAARLAAEVHAAVECERGPLAAEARWTLATVRARQGDHAGAAELIRHAIEGLDSHADLTLWMRLRLAAASLALQAMPPEAERARSFLDTLDAVLPLVASPQHLAEFLLLKGQTAFLRGELEQARAACRQAAEGRQLLFYRDRVRLDVLEARIAVASGEPEALARLRHLAAEAQAAGNPDLAAEVWRAVADTLAPPLTPAPSSA
ncbi:helix-turn-helix domain-containing protein [Streptomyces sp. NPDC001380]|uniref:helix-turn-helix domain-containing protein n=1 Tax=Streptomyces sp. NPDC001380 TaxID=3364566 RepID=UPI0036B48109